MAKYDINTTMIATSDPPSLCDGLALFPPFPTIGAGLSLGSEKRAKLLDHGFRYLAVRAAASFEYGAFFGVCGPGYAVKFNLEGEVEDFELSLSIKDDEFVGGFGCGMNFGVKIGLTGAVYKVHWLSGSWSSELNIDASIELDLVELAIDILLEAIEAESIKAAVEKAAPLTGAFTSSLSIVDGEEGEWAASEDGKVTINPMFDIPINLWPVLVLASQAGDEAGIGIIVLGINAVLNATLSGIGFGPQIGVGIPLNLGISKVTLDDKEYTNPTDDLTNGKWVGISTGIDLDHEPTEMKVELTHTAGFSFSFGVFVSLQLLEVFHIGASDKLAVAEWLDIIPQIRPFSHTLSNTVGQDYVAGGARDVFTGPKKVAVEFA